MALRIQLLRPGGEVLHDVVRSGELARENRIIGMTHIG
jgi:hypothetical protein